MSTPDTTPSPIINPQAAVEHVETYGDVDSCCMQWLPASQMGFYLKFVLIVCTVFGAASFAVYLLLNFLAK